MRIGVNAVFTERTVGPAKLARAVEERGFAALSVPEHTHIPVVRDDQGFPLETDVPSYFQAMYDPFVSLAVAAAVTTRISLITGVLLLSQRDVITTAKAIGTLNQVSGGGRLMVGVSAGWHRGQAANHGINPQSRGRVLVEKVQAVRHLLTDPVAEFHGTYVNVEPAYLEPKYPDLRIYMGGESLTALRRVARYADGYLAPGFLPLDRVLTLVDTLRQLSNRPMPVTIQTPADDEETLSKYAEAGIEAANIYLVGGDRNLDTDPLTDDEALRTLDEWTVLIDKFAD